MFYIIFYVYSTILNEESISTISGKRGLNTIFNQKTNCSCRFNTLKYMYFDPFHEMLSTKIITLTTFIMRDTFESGASCGNHEYNFSVRGDRRLNSSTV